MFEWEEDNFSYEDSDHFEEVRFSDTYKTIINQTMYMEKYQKICC